MKVQDLEIIPPASVIPKVNIVLYNVKISKNYTQKNYPAQVFNLTVNIIESVFPTKIQKSYISVNINNKVENVQQVYLKVIIVNNILTCKVGLNLTILQM